MHANASCARSQRGYHLPSSLTLRNSPQGSHLPRAAPRIGKRAGCCALSLSLSPSHPPAGLRGRDGASPARFRERRRAAQRAPTGPAALRLSRNRSRHLWAPGIATPGFKPAGIRGAVRAGCGRPRWQIAAAWPVPWLEGSQLFASCPWALAKRSGWAADAFMAGAKSFSGGGAGRGKGWRAGSQLSLSGGEVSPAS